MENERLLFIYLSSHVHISSEDALAFIKGDSSSGKSRLGARRVCEVLSRGTFPGEAGKIVEYCDGNDISIIAYPDTSYPDKLKHTGYAPPALYVRGDSSIVERFAGAVVGSRKPTQAGLRFCRKLAEEMALNDIPVISGFARGIDTCAHRWALEGNGKTVAVFGSGVDVIYPGENEELYHEVIESGCVLSRFPPGTQPFGWNFPIRNSIIAALSDFVCVVEAAQKSGSLITARYGAEYGKEVFSVPGNPLFPQSEGANRLIKNGAHPLTGIADILEAFGLSATKPKKKRKRRNDPDMTEIETRVLEILTDGMSLDDVASVMTEGIKDVSAALVMLEVKKLVERGPDGYYFRLA
ncbi:MAG: DNA-protecting protein DprA [Deltaproteobacteria bacterium]|nr:DNA-protecting protein DprA [Deltaproteobacteria bacterium]NIS76658.1 DNA-protecting protein DprA [Deltaproteobacteria bacterium]